MKIESTKNTKKTCMKHEIQKQSLHNQKIKKLSELFYYFILSSVRYTENIVFKKKLCVFLYTRSWWFEFETSHEMISQSEHQTSILLQDRASRDSFFTVLSSKSEHAALFTFKVLLWDELWSTLRVSFWSAHLDRACCFHPTMSSYSEYKIKN